MCKCLMCKCSDACNAVTEKSRPGYRAAFKILTASFIQSQQILSLRQSLL